MSGKKLQKIESGFYLIFSVTLLSGFLIILLTRLALNIKIGPIILTIFFVISVFSVLLFLFTAKKSINARYVFLEFMLLLLIVFGFDIFLRLVNFPYSYAFKHAKHKYNNLKTLVQLRQKGLNVMPFITPTMMREFNEQYGVDLFFGNAGNSQIVGDEEDDGLIVFKTDANGFRNKSGLYENKEMFDVFLLGDSFAQGSWVPDGFTIPDHIARETGLSVYNAANGGTGFITQLAIFLEYGVQKKPKNVIMLYNEAVFFNRALVELKNVALKKYFQEQKPLNIMAKNNIKNRILKDLIDIEYLKSLLDYEEKHLNKEKNILSFEKFIYNSKILSLVQNLMQNYRGEGYPDCEKIIAGRNIIKKVFECFKKETERYGGKFAVVFLADGRFYFKDWPDCEYNSVASLCDELDIPFVDLVKVFNRQKDPKIFFAHNAYVPTIGGHCNRKGYELIAKEIINQLLLKKNRER